MDIENSAFLDDYKILKTLGQGYHAKVKLAQRGNEAPVALKIFKKTHAFEKNKEALLKEFQSMQGLDHPNLIKLIDIKPNAIYKKKNGQQYNSMAIILEFAGAGELFEYVSTCGRFDEQTTRTYFQQLVNGLQYIHNAGICHRDLKPENLLYDKDFILKVADFGFATAIAGKEGDGYLSTVLGTESYMCPEIHQRVKYEGPSADLFAAGIILFIILTGHPPFMKADPKDPYYKLLTVNKHSTFWKAHSKNKPGKEAFFSDEIKNLFNAMFAYQPGQRATLEEIKSHAWYNGPTKSMQEIKQEFLKRQQAVEKELEAQRIQKQQEKAQQQGNYVFAGVGKFRSGDEVTDEFAGLDSKFTNIGNSRNMKGYFQQPGKQIETLTVIDPDYLLKLILKNADQYSTETTVKDDTYKIKFNFTDSNGVSTKYNVEFLKKDEDITCVDFQKISGSSIDYFTQTEKIKKLIKDGKIEQEGQPQEA